MSKKHIEAFIKAQFASLGAKDTKERLGYTVAGIKDGKFYDLKGRTDYGSIEDAEDCVFIPEDTMQLSRITTVKINAITANMNSYFAVGTTEEAEEAVEAEEAEEAEEEAIEYAEVDYDALSKACKKAIKKGDVKKASKLLAKLEGQDCHKKLSKKLSKVA